jgi:hypothetical protein
MKISRHRRLRADTNAPLPPQPSAPTAAAVIAGTEPAAAPSLPALVAGVFTRLHLAQRARVLRRLLRPVGPMALAVVGGGVFAKYALQARWERMSVSLEDAAAVTSAQVFDLVRYVEQANPAVLQQVMAFLARDTTTMAALGAGVTAILLQQLARTADQPVARGSGKR